MISDLREINRILLVIDALTIDGHAKLSDVIDECKNTVLGGKRVNHEETIDFCVSSGIILKSNEFITYSPLGKKIFDVNLEGFWELNNLQKTLLIENCFLDGYFLEKSIATAAKFTLFEFNDEFTRAQFRNMVEPFLRDVQGRRGIYDFRVVADETNNTGEVIDRNEFIGDIYIKPARAINFIQLNFVAVRTGVEFSEVVGKF